MGTLAAGAIGSLITLAVAFLVRLAALPAEIRSHDRRAHECDEDLASWIGDRDLRLRRELRTKRQELAPKNLLDSGEYMHQLSILKERALHEWRDQERQARRDVAAIYDREGLLHRAWRRGRTPVTLQTPAAAEPVLDAWRTAPITPGNRERGHAGMAIDDPTTRMLELVVADVSARLADYQ
jgi:hypothetical protein